MSAHPQETYGTRPVPLARIHGQLDSVLVLVLHHLADSVAGEDGGTEEAVGTFADPVPSARVSPSGTSRLPPKHSQSIAVCGGWRSELPLRSRDRPRFSDL